MNGKSGARHRPGDAKPYAMVGAGKLVSSIWKAGEESGGWRYSFNLFRLSGTGRVGQRFFAQDLMHLAKLTQVLAATLADDGCLAPSLRRELTELALRLEKITHAED